MFYAAKDTINKMKKQPTKWEKVFANHIVDNGLISRIYKEFNNHKTNKPIKKWTKYLNRLFCEKDMQMVHKQMKRY